MPSRPSINIRRIRFIVCFGIVLWWMIAAMPMVRPAHGQTGLKGSLFRTPQPTRRDALRSLPLDRLTPEARQRIVSVAGRPTLYRRLPSQVIACERDMFLYLTRNPDVLVGLWDLMGITKVQSQRLTPYKIEASDGVGTQCVVDLVYGDAHRHIFYVDGVYDGKMTPTPIRGKGVFVLYSGYGGRNDRGETITGTIDCFVQLDSLGIDLIARTLSPIIGKSADSNFEQTAQFIAQVNEASIRNPAAMLNIAGRLPQVTPQTRSTFAETILQVSQRLTPPGQAHLNAQAQSTARAIE